MAALILAGALIFGSVDGEPWRVSSIEALQPAVRVSTTVQVAPPPTVIDDYQPPAWARCPEWWATAVDAGWAEAELPTVDRIMYRESRCQPGVSHLNANGTIDRGLMQVNSIHRGWLADMGIGLTDLFDPWTNLHAARLLFEGSGWGPWGGS